MADDQNERARLVRFPEPVVEPAQAEERRREAEIARELEELGRALEGRDRLDRFGTAERAKSSLAQAGPSVGALILMGRGVEIVQEACRRAVAEMHRLTARQTAKNEADAREAVEKKALAEETEGKAAEELATVAAARREEARQAAEEKARAEAARKVAEAQALAAAQEAANRQAAEDARLQAKEAARKAAEGKLEKQAERAEAELAQERARSQALEQQLAIRQNEAQQLLVEERARSQELEQQLAARQNEAQQLLAHERARGQELERQLAARADDQKLLAQERARSQELERQLAAAEATLDRGRTAKVSPPDRPASMPTAPEAGNREAARLMAEARVLLDEGNIIAARGVLGRAAESGSVLALFLLAETYDRASLSTWGISGRRGDVKKARELYAKALAAGVHEAKHRLSVLR